MAFVPIPCATCGGDTGGPGQPAFDVERSLLCDIDAEGNIVGTALMVQIYDEGGGNPVGPPTPVDPVTGDPYVVQGTLQACPGDAGCGAPQQFCFSSTVTTDEPGRMYDLTFTMGRGFNVQGIIRDLVESPVAITWAATDTDGAEFAGDLQAAIQSQFPGQTVTVTPQNTDACNGTSEFAVHIECLRLDQTPPTLLQIRYNDGRDLVQNAAFDTTPPTFPVFVSREDDPFVPVGSATGVKSGTVNCTSIPDRGWESNDKSHLWELWGTPGQPGNQTATNYGTTPTPRGTPVFEINAWGSGPTPTAGFGNGDPAYGTLPDTIWQTFVVPAPGNFTVRAVVGGRGQTDDITIRLSTGDVNDAGIGDIINTVVNAPSVDAEGPDFFANPWTNFTQTVPLAAGTYTFALTGPDKPVFGDPPVGGANSYGGLFSDMRVFQDAPDTIADFTNDDDTCTVPVSSTSTVCEYWAPQCAAGQVIGWYNVADGEELTNADFWAQVPAPTCCRPEASDGGTGTTGNLIHSDLVCGVTESGTRTMVRTVISDQSGAAISETFTDTNGTVLTPSSWQPGDCSNAAGGGSAQVVANCANLGHPERLGPDLVHNGDFADSAGTGPASQEGPGWNTTLAPSGDVVVATPGQYALWEGDNATVSTDPNVGALALTGKSWLGSVAASTAIPFLGFKSVPVTDGRTYRFTADVLTFNDPGDWAVQVTAGPDILSNLVSVPGPGGTGAWAPVTVDLTYTGPDDLVELGFTTISGPDQVIGIDNVRFREVFPAVTQVLSPVTYQSTTRAVVDQVVRVAGCNDDRRDQLLTDAVTALNELREDAEPGDGQTLGPVCFQTIPPGPNSQPGFMTLDQNGDPVLYDTLGNLVADGTYVVVICPLLTQQSHILCDAGNANHQFLRWYIDSPIVGVPDSQWDLELDGATLYAVVGPVVLCGDTTVSDTRDAEILVLCDATPTRFLRKYLYDGETGAFTTVVNTTLDGTTPFVPVGAVGVCSVAVQTDFDFLSTVLCDANGTQFIQRLTFNSSTGAVTATTNTTLTGGAFVPVAPVALCTACCPVVVGEGCTNVGSLRYTAIRNPTTGAVSLIDSVSGAAVLPANIVACPSDDNVLTSTAEARLLTATQAWTPGADLVGTLTGLTFTVLTGTASLVDTSGTAVTPIPTGTSVSWSVEDNNILTAPVSITADAASTVLVNWTRR